MIGRSLKTKERYGDLLGRCISTIQPSN